MKKFITLICLMALLIPFKKINAQITRTNNTATVATEYCGWDGTGSFSKDLDITNLFTGKNINLNTNNTGTSGSSTTKMTILGNNGSTSGYVGIGTATPANLLHEHAINVSGTVQPSYLQWTNASTNCTNGLWCGINSSAVGIINMKDNQALNFYTNDARRMHFNDGTGSVAGFCSIGDLSSPQSRLHVREGGSSDCWLQLTGNATGDASTDGLRIGVINSGTQDVEFRQQESADMLFYTRYSSVDERMRIKSGGNIGIGTASPSARLHVVGETPSGVVAGLNAENVEVNGNNYATYLTGVDINVTGVKTNGGGTARGINLNIASTDVGTKGIECNVVGSKSGGTPVGTYYGAQFTVSACNSDGVATGYGVQGYATGAYNNASGKNYGGHFTGTGTTDKNYGVYGLASGSGTTNYGIYGDVTGGTTNYAGYFNGDVTVTGTFSNPSDSILKTNVQDINNALQIINQLNPKTYNFKSKAQLNANLNLPSGTHAGLIAENVSMVLPSIVSDNIQPSLEDSSGNSIYPSLSYKGIVYDELIPYLIAAVKELKAEVDALQPAAGGGTGSVFRSNGSQNVTLENSSMPVLYQNQPNPFSNNTTINYFIPENTGKAEMSFYNSTGTVLKSIVISQMGQGSVEVDASNLSSDIYSYSLIVDGKVIDTKRMMKTK